MTHNELALDLAAHIRRKTGRMVWTDMQLGPSGSPRPDVYSLEPSFKNFRPMAYEVKVTVADYRRDVTSGKWQSYLPFAAGVIFAAPTGLIDKKDLPAGCGLMVRGERGWVTLKAPTLAKIATLPHEAWCKLLIDGVQVELARRHADERPAIESAWQAERKIREKLGEHVEKILRDRLAAESFYERETEQLHKAAQGVSERVRKLEEDIVERARKEAAEILKTRTELALALGLQAHASVAAIQYQAAMQMEALKCDSHIAGLQRALRNIERAFREALTDPALASPSPAP